VQGVSGWSMICLVTHGVCDCMCPIYKRKRLKLSTPNLVDIERIAVTRHPFIMRSKGHKVIKSAANVDMHVDGTA